MRVGISDIAVAIVWQLQVHLALVEPVTNCPPTIRETVEDSTDSCCTLNKIQRNFLLKDELHLYVRILDEFIQYFCYFERQLINPPSVWSTA